MALNTSKDLIIAHRRELVARWRLQGKSQREIVEALADLFLNPDTGEPYALGTINSDCRALDREWRTKASVKVGRHKARHFAELQEVKRVAWANDDLNAVLRALKQEADLLGLDAPKQLDVILLRQRAQEVADRLGVPLGDVLSQSERVAAGAWADRE